MSRRDDRRRTTIRFRRQSKSNEYKILHSATSLHMHRSFLMRQPAHSGRCLRSTMLRRDPHDLVSARKLRISLTCVLRHACTTLHRFRFSLVLPPHRCRTPVRIHSSQVHGCLRGGCFTTRVLYVDRSYKYNDNDCAYKTMVCEIGPSKSSSQVESVLCTTQLIHYFSYHIRRLFRTISTTAGTPDHWSLLLSQ